MGEKGPLESLTDQWFLDHLPQEILEAEHGNYYRDMGVTVDDNILHTRSQNRQSRLTNKISTVNNPSMFSAKNPEWNKDNLVEKKHRVTEEVRARNSSLKGVDSYLVDLKQDSNADYNNDNNAEQKNGPG